MYRQRGFRYDSESLFGVHIVHIIHIFFTDTPYLNFSLRLTKLCRFFDEAHQAEASRRTDFYNAEKLSTSSITASWLLVFSSAGYIS